ncbi:MAG: HU family DNA-binding protein [Elusimicrobiota bacterium]|jgi:nucleoid DNA-binding protein|nr:HU family DNA-binding protein [Elusimicrobiota bacterium]
MNKEDIINELAKRLYDKKQARSAVDNALDIICAALKKGEKVVISNFGTFKAKESAPIRLKNPLTGADVYVHSKTRVRFKPSGNILK